MHAIGGWGLLCLIPSAALAGAPYEPPPFPRFPDEPTDLPPLHRDDDTLTWRDVLHDLPATRLRVIAGVDAPAAR